MSSRRDGNPPEALRADPQIDHKMVLFLEGPPGPPFLVSRRLKKKCADICEILGPFWGGGGGGTNHPWAHFFVSGALGGPREPHLSTESLKVTLGAPKCLPKWSKIIEKLPQNHQKISKNTPEYGYQVLLKKSKERIGGHSALYFILCWCSDFGQSMDTSFQ